MPIIDMQRSMRELGRIRMGHQVASGRSRRPEKLEHFRLTSGDKTILGAAAEVYGGAVREWKEQPGQFELYTDSSELRIWMLPGQAFSQWYEIWTAGGCQRRCDGRWEYIGDQPCLCDPMKRACDEHTRLSVMLPDVVGIGSWRLETQSYYAAMELAGMSELLHEATARGQRIEARLRIDQRKKVANGETHRFVVPVIDLDVSLRQALGSASSAPALGAGPTLDDPVAAVSPPDAAASPAVAPGQRAATSIEEGLAALEAGDAAPKRRKTAAPLGSALEPEEPAEIPAGSPAPPPASEDPPAQAPKIRYATDGQRKLLFATARDRHLDEPTIKAAIREVTGQESSKAIPASEFSAVLAVIQAHPVAS